MASNDPDVGLKPQDQNYPPHPALDPGHTHTASGQGLPLGLAGATAATRYVGGTVSGPPVSGVFQTGDENVAQNGAIWVCTAGGTPGTWVNAATAGAGVVTSVAGRTGAVVIATTDIAGLGTSATHPASDFDTAGAAATVQGNLTTEAATRATADTTNATAIASETSNRTSADLLLIPLTQKGANNGVATLDNTGKIPAGQIPSEGTEVTAVVAGTHTTVDNTNPTQPIVNVTGADFDAAGVAAGLVATEATTRATADTTLQTNITNEATARTNADTTNATAIASEVTARASADTTLTTNVATNTTSIATETTRATAQELLKLAKASNLSDLASVKTALANLNVPTLYAAAYGVVANDTTKAAANIAILNDLCKYAESLGGANIVLPTASLVRTAATYVNAPLVMRTAVTISGGAGGTVNSQTTLRLGVASNCSVRQWQRYISTAVAYNAGTTYGVTYTNGATSFCTSGGFLYQSLVTANIGNTPSTSQFQWAKICPTNTTTFNGVATINTTPQSLTVTDGTQFGQFGGTMQFTVAGTTYQLFYTGVIGPVVAGCQLASGSVAIAGNETIFPFDATNTAAMNVCFHGGWPSASSPGTWAPVDNYSSTLGGDFNFNVTVTGGCGDGWGLYGGGSGFAYNGQRVHIGCTALSNAGTGKLATADSLVSNDVAGQNGLGGHSITGGNGSHTITASKSWNNGRQPLWKAKRTVTDGVTNGTNFQSATAVFSMDDIGNFLYDSAGSSAAGTNIPANTFIIDVLSATSVTMSKAALVNTSGITTNLCGSYPWPIATGTTNIIVGAIDPADGFFYLMKNAVVTSNTAPSADSANWQKIRLAIDWGWSLTESGGTGENGVDLDCQSDKFGSYNAVNSNGSTVTLRANGWISNPWSWNNAQGKPIGAYTVPAALQAAACVNLGSSIGHNVRVVARQSLVPASPVGTIIIPGTATRCIVSIATDGNYLNVMTAAPTVTTQITVDGIVYGLWAINPETLYTGPAGGTSGVCLAQTCARSLATASATPGQGVIRAVGVFLPAGVTITKLGWASGPTGATTPTHQWLGLYNSAGTLLANVADQLTAAVAATTAYQYSVVTPVTTTYSGLYYLGISLSATVTNASVAAQSNVVGASGVAPITSGAGNASATPVNLTVPLAAGYGPYLWAS